MSEPATGPGAMSEAEANKVVRLLSKYSPKNDGIRFGGGIGAWVSIAMLALNVALAFMWGGKYLQRLEVLETAQKEQATINREVALHSVQIAVTINQLNNIEGSIKRIEAVVTK